jgi:serine/threonine protein kinase
MDLASGQSFAQPGVVIAGRYEVVRTLGSGGMGTVIEVADRALDNEAIALKLLYPHLAQERTSFARFRNEVLVARRLSHPNIVRLYDIGNAGGGYYYISMEYLPGGSLSRQIYEKRRDTLSFAETLRILREIAAGIGYAHRSGVVHRDLKPDNILLGDRGEVKVTDFGLARTLYIDKGFTDTGEAVGTPYYMAPEQLRGDKVDGRCDIYALGLIAFEMVVGRRPFFDESYLQLAALHMREPIPDFATRESGIPQWYEDFVKKCAAKQREQRFQTAEEIVDLLNERLQGSKGGNDRVRQRPAILSFYADARRSSHRSWINRFLFGTFFTICVGAGSWLALHQSPYLRGKVQQLGRMVNPFSSSVVPPEQFAAVVRAGNLEQAVTLLGAGADVNGRDAEGKTPLMIALESGHPELARRLLEFGASIMVADANKVTPLMYAVSNPANGAFASELIRRGADYDARDSNAKVPLTYAVQGGNAAAVQLLLDRGVIVSARDSSGMTPLMYAARLGNEEIVRSLLRRPIDVEGMDSNGRTALSYAAELKTSSIAELLIDAGANPNRKDSSGKSPMDYATLKNRRLLKSLSAK